MKTTKTTITIAALAATFACSSVLAESRVWTDATGKTITAEQTGLLNDKVLLRLENGREINVSLETLSAEDRLLAMLNQPPKLEVKVAAKVSRSNSSLRDAGPASRYQVQEETVSVDARIRKSSSSAYEAELAAELYVIGEHENGYVVLDKTETAFTFTAGGGKEHVVSSKPITVENISGERFGAEYKGYLLVVTDSRGEVVEMKASNGTIEREAEAIIATHPVRRRDKGLDRLATLVDERHFRRL
ncbi:hypothetical protein PDESU_06232 [Pontiella desulfatans]|uniref:SLA1 homology domain-containing protein n=1 Tax=Pontiella desulfatans TaxID=2750659 RepID=A0A6C2UDY4_PONDE|nr:SHD1 domain-containing protein [Pontiella desulfatans]VGO17631.1 hypothetical protein PDESU_06232 [Pontiella desulfatans]